MDYLDGKFEENKARKELKKFIPKIEDETEVKNAVLPYGLSLLLEITLNFSVYCQQDVSNQELKHLLLVEYKHILDSLVHSRRIYLDTLNKQ